MILVTGSVLARAETLDELLRLSVEHVRRSRAEAGCLSHAVHRDAENPLRLVFAEEWADSAALEAHFAVPASREFAKALRRLAAEPPTMKVYTAETAQIPLRTSTPPRGA
jgi:quinol monooxygenase YgiN